MAWPFISGELGTNHGAPRVRHLWSSLTAPGAAQRPEPHNFKLTGREAFFRLTSAAEDSPSPSTEIYLCTKGSSRRYASFCLALASGCMNMREKGNLLEGRQKSG